MGLKFSFHFLLHRFGWVDHSAVLDEIRHGLT
jgi:hypothetical protein